VAVTVVEVVQSAVSANVSTVTATLSNTPAAGDVIIASYKSLRQIGARDVTSVSGCGATWSAAYNPTVAEQTEWWKGVSGNASGTVTVTQNFAGEAQLTLYLVRGLTASTVVGDSTETSTNATSLTGPTQTADNGQIVLSSCVSVTGSIGAPTFPSASTPSGWTTVGVVSGASAARHGGDVYRIPTSSASHRVDMTSPINANLEVSQIVLGDVVASGSDAVVTATLPALTSDAAATSTVTVATGAALPSLTASGAGTVSIPAAASATLPALTAAVVATSDDTVPGSVAATLPALTSTVTATHTATVEVAGTLPALTSSTAASVTYPAAVGATLPALTAAVEVDVTEDGSATATVTATLPALSGDANVANLAEAIVTCLVNTSDGVLVVVPLVPSTELDHAVPVTRTSVLAPVLSAVYPAHPEQGHPDAPEVVRSTVGVVHLWVGGQDVTYFRGGMTVIRRWESEAPFGDTVAAFEFPQLNPWDAPGAGDLAFLRKDTPVAIGMVETTVGDGFVRVHTRRLWSGFLDARGNGLGEGEDYSWEAKGTFWQAQGQIREPVALTEPVDIGVQIARTLNAVEGRRWRTMPLTPIGITTLTRGSRDETFWDYVQALLSEAIDDDGRQWTLSEDVPGVPRLVQKPAMSTVHATVAYGTPGVDIDLRVDESTRVDRVFMRGIGPKMGGWANVFYPGIELLAVPPYPMASLGDYMGLGTRDSDTTSGTGVTDWQRRVSEIKSFANPPVSGVMSSAWVAVIDDLQRYVGVTPDGSLGPQTWNATFDRAIRGIDMRPVRLPLASKPAANKYLYSAAGVKLGANPAYDSTLVVRDVAIDVGPGKSKAQGRKLARKILAQYGTAAANGQIVWTFDPNETDRTHLSHLTNVKVLGFEGSDRVVQVASKSVELEAGDDGPVYVVTTRVDERARDAMAVEDLLEQRREAKPDPSRNPANRNKASRQVSDQRTPWDSESPCGVLRRTAVNGSSGLWTVVTVPFAEVGKLAGIRLRSTRPFYFALFASLRITENKMAAWVGNPSTQDDPWRDAKHHLDDYGIIEAWGEKGNACGYSPKTEADGGSFTGDFILDTPVDYWTETVPYVSVAIFMSDGSGWIEGEFIPAYEP
jgi:hypothetical protein